MEWSSFINRGAVSEYSRSISNNERVCRLRSIHWTHHDISTLISCTRMKPDWDLLAEQAHSSVFVADVNCLIESALCADYHTGGTYPTVLVFQNTMGAKRTQLYQGGRGYEDLQKFVDKELIVKCDLTLPDSTCSEKEQNYVTKWKERRREAWKKELGRLSAMKKDTMTYELAKWLGDRIRILEQLLAPGKDQEEL
jgi:hypothetical protein